MDSSTVVKFVGISGAFNGIDTALLYEMRWWLLACFILTIADFKFGVERSLAEHIPFRKSTAIRRTVNKLFDYVMWLLLAGVLAHAIGEPIGWNPLVIESFIMAVAIFCEVESCAQNYFEARGYKYKFSLKTFFITLLKKKNEDLGEAVEESLDIKKEDDKPETT